MAVPDTIFAAWYNKEREARIYYYEVYSVDFFNIRKYWRWKSLLKSAASAKRVLCLAESEEFRLVITTIETAGC